MCQFQGSHVPQELLLMIFNLYELLIVLGSRWALVRAFVYPINVYNMQALLFSMTYFSGKSYQKE